MAKSKNKKKFDSKTWIYVGLLIVALVLVIVAIVNFSQNEKFDSGYFHDDDSKIVLTMDRNTAALDDSIYEPNITHIVYYYDGNKITGVRAFYEYSTEEEAKTAYAHLGLGDYADGKKLSGRFIVFNVKSMQYENLTVEDLKKNVELLKGIDALILDYGEGYINRFGTLDFGDATQDDGSAENTDSTEVSE